MAGTKEIKRRIKSVKNTKKITKAMELVAASKMKRAVSSTLSSRLYSEYSWEVLTSIAKGMEDQKEEIMNPFFTERETKNVKNVLLVLITSNRGLCGAYNAQVIKKAIALIKNDQEKEIHVDLVTIGKRGDTGMRRIGQKIIATFTDIGDHLSLSNILPVSKLVMDEYMLGNYDKVLIAYTDFISALSQKPNIRQILPISHTVVKELAEDLETHKVEKHSNTRNQYLFEGDRELLLDNLAQKVTRMQVYQMLLESNASEQSSRMVAMKNASEASGEMIDDLTLVFNKARQSNITREISEISAGMASVN